MQKMFIALVFYSCFGEAFGWSNGMTSKWDELSKHRQNLISGGTFGTFWGGFRRGFYWSSNKGVIKKIKPPGLKKSISVYVRNWTGKADLYLFIPGVFGKTNGRVNPHVIDSIEKNDVHVALIPNLVASELLIARPEYDGDNLYGEGSLQRAIIKNIIGDIGLENISRIHVIAESLGSYQALTAFLPDEKESLRFDSLTLLWPPLYLNRALGRFDKLIHESHQLLQKCTLWWKWPGIMIETKFKKIPSGVTEEDKRCFGAWVIGTAFVDAIKSNSRDFFIDAARSDSPIPDTFTDFTKAVIPQFGPILDGSDSRFSVEYLLTLYKGQEGKIRMVSSRDDFLNEPGEWEKLKTSFPEYIPNIYLFSWGGHSGPASLEGFIEEIVFDLNKKNI